MYLHYLLNRNSDTITLLAVAGIQFVIKCKEISQIAMLIY